MDRLGVIKKLLLTLGVIAGAFVLGALTVALVALACILLFWVYPGMLVLLPLALLAVLIYPVMWGRPVETRPFPTLQRLAGETDAARPDPIPTDRDGKPGSLYQPGTPLCDPATGPYMLDPAHEWGDYVPPRFSRIPGARPEL